jgi:hypothetical protein
LEFTRCKADEEHKDGSLGVSVANGCGHRWEPLVGVSVELILDYLVVVQGDSDHQGAKESSCI